MRSQTYLRQSGMHLVLFLSALLFSTLANSAEKELGRLFFTPENRQALDQQRRFRPPEKPREVTDDSPLTVNGLVLRSSGKKTVWINGEMKNDATLTVKVGDTLDKNTGETTPLLGEGKVVVHPAGKRAKAR